MKPIQIAALFIAVSVAIVLFVMLIMRPDPETAPPLPVAPEPAQVAAPPVPKPHEPDLSTSQKLSRDEVRVYYQSLEEKISGYRTVKARTRIQFPKILPDQPMESEFWFDAVRPAPFILRAYSAERKDDKDMASDWAVVPNASEWSDGKAYKMVSYKRKNVHSVDLEATDKASQSVVGPTVRKCGQHYADPLQDLLFGVSYDDRLKEFLEASQNKTSTGDQVRVLYRINNKMSEQMKSNRLLIHLPVTKKAVEYVVLREDYFQAQTRELLKSIYYDRERDPYIVQTYLEVEWDQEIPDDRFALELPPNVKHQDVNAKLRRNHAWNLRPEDALPYLADDNLTAEQVEEIVEKKILPAQAATP